MHYKFLKPYLSCFKRTFTNIKAFIDPSLEQSKNYMKILLTIHHYLDPDAGAPGSVLKLGQAYENLGHEVSYYAFDHLPPWAQRVSEELIFPDCLASHLAKHAHQYDVVDASTGDAWIWGSLRHRHSPLLVTRSHGLEHSVHLQYMEDVKQGKQHRSWKYPIYRGGFHLWEVAQSLRCADLAFLLNQQDLQYTIGRLGVHPDRAFVTHDGIPESFLNCPLTLNSSGDDLRIVQIGTYIARKGIQYSVPALNTVLTRHPNVTLTLLGTDCPSAQVLADFDAALSNRIQVVPRFDHQQLPELLKDHHIKLFTPLSEGFGKVLVEAMALGLAPITTAAAGPLEVVTADHDALVVPIGDSQAIEQALEQLISDRSLLNTLRHRAYHTAQGFGWSTLAQQRLDLYQTALTHRSRPQ
jgi:glycosyltransferase involved in cell wall biosynthesis